MYIYIVYSIYIDIFSLRRRYYYIYIYIVVVVVSRHPLLGANSASITKGFIPSFWYKNYFFQE